MNDSIELAIQNYAKECGISAADVRNMALGVVAEIEKMKAAETFIDNPEIRTELCVIGLQEHIKQFNKFSGAFKSYKHIRKVVLDGIYNDLTSN